MDYTAGKGTTALGIIGTALGGIAVAGGSLLGAANAGQNGNGARNGGQPVNEGCSEDHFINRYEAAQQARIAELETEIKLRDANTYTDQKSLEMYKYIDGRLRDVEAQIGTQAVVNQKTADSFALAAADLAAARAELKGDIKLEAERRCCADNAIVNYANATFYPKQVADVTVGTTTTGQTLYNPIPKCGECCGN